MKAAFLCENSESIYRVYGPNQLKAIEERVELLSGVFASLEDEALRDVEVIFSTWGMIPGTVEQIRKYLPKLKEVYYSAGSVQYFGQQYLQAGVRVFSAWKANAVPVAEFAFAQIMLALKGFFRVQPTARSSRQAALELFRCYPGGFDVKVGLLGCGAVGSLVAKLLKQTDVEVLVFDPFLSDERAAELNVRRTDMKEIFAECEVVSNHLANLPATVGIIRREYLLSMKPYSTFINTGRGPQLDEKDLYDMLTTDATRTALLDVMTNEHNSDNNPLNGLANCLITPHIAGSAGCEVRRMAEYMIRAFDCVRRDEKCEHEVFAEMLASMA